MESNNPSLPTLQTPDFLPEPDQEKPQWLNYLNETGYTVVQNVLSSDEVTAGVDKYW